MKDLFQLVSWAALIVGWGAAVLWAFIFRTTGLAVGLGMLAVFSWIGWGAFLFWLFGARRRMQRHLGDSLRRATFLDKEIGASRVADVRRALESLYADKGAVGVGRLGVEFGYARSLSSLQEGNATITPLRWSSFESQTGQFENFPVNAIYLLHHADRPFVAHLYSSKDVTHAPEDDSGTAEEPGVIATGKGQRLQVFAASIEEAAEAIGYLLRVASVTSVYRGKMLHVSSRGPGVAGQAIRVSDRPRIDDERIVLPPQVLEVVQRTIAARLEFHRLLQRHGHSSKTGILLHGAPGTGKTLVAKHLIGACQNHTAIVPTGLETETLREAFRLAAYLQPALVVIEDVDLLGERRESNANVTGLQELMNEMDGLAPATEAIVLMTTNRPEALEPALAARPGRVSQAIHFPLPDAPRRERLLRMFCAAADTRQVDFPHWVKRTAGASPAFLEELVKRAILFAAPRLNRAADGATVHLTNEDFDRAIHELVVFGGKLTSNMLGFPQAAESSAAAPAE